MDLFRPRKPIFRSRRHAGTLLADELDSTIQFEDKPVVFAIPRGGIPVAAEVALRFAEFFLSLVRHHFLTQR